MALAKLIIVEDDVLTREALASSLEFAGFQIISAVATASAALEAARSESPEVALLDLDLGLGPTGIDIAHALRKEKPRIGIVFLTSFADPRLSRSANTQLPVGARYLTKQQVEGLSRVATTLLQAKFQPLASNPTIIFKTELSDHQISALKLLVAGLNNSEIAQKLGVSEKAVEHSITRIARTLGVSRVGNMNLRVGLLRHYSQLIGKALPD